jgi:NAD(P)-dependent dehydrogenase (short-subunit alcohol dehydrogenase family)
MIHYGMSKTAQLSLTRGFAQALAKTGVTVNAVLPGPTLSEGVGGFLEHLAKAHGKTVAELEKGFFEHVSAHLAVEALHRSGGESRTSSRLFAHARPPL